MPPSTPPRHHLPLPPSTPLPDDAPPTTATTKVQTPGSGISILLAVGTPSIGSGNLYCQWEPSPGSRNALCILFLTYKMNKEEILD
nr:hypothetical protein [Tanacetum cinerariifolium]